MVRRGLSVGKSLGILASTSLLCVLLICTARAGVAFDPNAYASLATADSKSGIPEGTRITTKNWQQYKQFMPIGMQALFGGGFNWKIDTAPDSTMVVGPTIPTVQPKQFLLDTEKYSNQAQLIKLPQGSYTVKGYVAGLPFPNPTEPDLGAKAFFDAYYEYRPFVAWYDDPGWLVDAYHNTAPSDTEVAAFRLSHLSDPGYPSNPPFGAGYIFSDRYFVHLPEQSKYTTEIALYRDDPALAQELYVFLPSLRRSLRLSSRARCSPILGSDYAQDDNNDFLGVLITEFSVKSLGTKKILAMMHEDPSTTGHPSSFVQPSGGMPGWPTPTLGKWELRDVYALDLMPLPDLARGYCYGHKVVYVDIQSWVPVSADIFDPNGGLWKFGLVNYHPWTVNGGDSVIIPQVVDIILWDLQNSHTTLSTVGKGLFDQQAPQKYQDVGVMAFPASLAQVLQ
jgi:Protein of unknown function (DUF1329)